MLIFKIVMIVILFLLMLFCMYEGLYNEKDEVCRRMGVIGGAMMGMVLGTFITVVLLIG